MKSAVIGQKQGEHHRTMLPPVTPARSQAASLHPVLQLQQQIGNQAVLRMLSHTRSAAQTKPTLNQPGDHYKQEASRVSGEATRLPQPSPAPPSLPIQAKLEIGAVDDPLEREADRVAERVMRMPDPAVATSPDGDQLVQRKCAECEEDEHKKIAGKESGGAAALDGTAAPPIVHEVLRSPGQQLDSGTRAFFEARFGYDFGHVRIHADSRAARSAGHLNALAYTAGNNIVFSTGQHAPNSALGRQLLAHELAHVVQQQQSPASTSETLLCRVRANEVTSVASSQNHLDSQTDSVVNSEGNVRRHEFRPQLFRWNFTANVVGRGLTKRPLQRKTGPGPERFTMEPEEITVPTTNVGPGRTATQEIDQLVQSQKTNIGSFWTSYRDGLSNFETGLLFSSKGEAAPTYSKAFLGAVFEGIKHTFFVRMCDKAKEFLKLEDVGMDAIVDTLSSAIEAVVKESERAEAASGEAEIGEYIQNARNAAGPQEREQYKQIDTEWGPDLYKRYAWMAAAHPQSGQATARGQIVGRSAEFINNLLAFVTGFAASIPSAQAFQQEFVEKFAASSTEEAFISQPKHALGALRLKVQAFTDGRQSWAFTISDSWRLETYAARSNRLAAQLQKTLLDMHQKPHQSHLEKIVDVKVIEVTDRESKRGHFLADGYIHFNQNPDDAEYRTNYDPMLFREAWSQSDLKRSVLEVLEIRD